MRIAVIGKGNIGARSAASGSPPAMTWLRARHVSGEGPGGAPVTSIGDAIEHADVVVLAVPGEVVADMVTEHGAALLSRRSSTP